MNFFEGCDVSLAKKKTIELGAYPDPDPDTGIFEGIFTISG